MDILTPSQRSARMSRIRSRDTKPEKALRSALHRAGFRFRLHAPHLPGTPDIVFPARRKVIFVHGCFWHMHRCQRPTRQPKSNREYWIPKLQANRKRDARNRRRLAVLGWRTLTIWECEIKQIDKALRKAARFLQGMMPVNTCARCGRRREIYARKVCASCYHKIRPRVGVCANCGRSRKIYAKGECKPCRDALYRGYREAE